MLEKPDLADEKIIACLQDEYDLQAARLAFLPLGADQNTVVYRVDGQDGIPYFVKLRKGDFDEIAVRLPKFLCEQGIRQIIPPLAARSGRLWAVLEAYRLILYPFIEGRDGYQVNLTDRQWVEFGQALRHIQSIQVPADLANRVPRESFSPRWRETVKAVLARLDGSVWGSVGEDSAGKDRLEPAPTQAFVDSVAAECAAFVQAKRVQIFDLVLRAEGLAQVLQAHSPEFVLCHADIHAGNIHVTPGGEIYIVDWDNPIFAPKERDLMYAGGGQFANWRTPQEEERLFYQGYEPEIIDPAGPVQVDPAGLAYYRYERIVTDIAIYCEQLLLSDAGGEDRAQSLKYLKSNFLPGGVIEIAYKGDKAKD
jgi:spectinomycin phosphotransferase